MNLYQKVLQKAIRIDYGFKDDKGNNNLISVSIKAWLVVGVLAAGGFLIWLLP